MADCGLAFELHSNGPSSQDANASAEPTAAHDSAAAGGTKNYADPELFADGAKKKRAGERADVVRGLYYSFARLSLMSCRPLISIFLSCSSTPHTQYSFGCVLSDLFPRSLVVPAVPAWLRERIDALITACFLPLHERPSSLQVLETIQGIYDHVRPPLIVCIFSRTFVLS